MVIGRRTGAPAPEEAGKSSDEEFFYF